MTTRRKIMRYAKSVCLLEIEKWATIYESGMLPDVADSAGYGVTFSEGILRPLWGLAPVIKEEDIEINVSGMRYDLAYYIAKYIDEITNPTSENYLGRYGLGHSVYFQSITELAGALLCFYFAKEQMWDTMPIAVKDNLARFVLDGCEAESEYPAENNHLWFPVLCMTVLKKLGYTRESCDGNIRMALDKLETMYQGNGWYSDGAKGRTDYYVAWSMVTYPLLWTLIEDESFDGYAEMKAKYVARTNEFLGTYVSFFAENGAHVPFGRSLAYRFAASCVFPVAVMAGCDISPSLAKSITVANISYFADNMKSNDDTIEAGYLYPSPSLVEFYTAGGGSYWCAKTFLCLLMDESHPFWSSEVVGIPQTDCEIDGGNIMLRHDGSGVTMYNNGTSYHQHGRYCNPFLDMAGCYCKFAYNSTAGFAFSTHDTTSIDNMISLITEDESMTSHRGGFEILHDGSDALVSVHRPFANDEGTVVKTYLIPLTGSVHARIHVVTLAHRYKIAEGGYSVPLVDDGRRKTSDGGVFSISDGRITSSMRAVATVVIGYGERRSQPGMHLLSPRSHYPVWQTNLLEPGRYVFATVFGVGLDGAPKLPEVSIDGNEVTVGERKIVITQ